MYILGIDGGGTAAKAVLAHEDGTIVTSGCGGACNYSIDGLEAVGGAISQAYSQIKADFPHETGAISHIVAGISGAGRPVEQEQVKKVLASMFAQSKVTVTNDAEIAMYGGLAGEPGAVVISGTGSIGYGLGMKGEICRVGGWGYLVDDEGSSFAIGRQILQGAFLSYDGRIGREPELEELVLRHFHCRHFEDVIPVVYSRPLNRGIVAGLAKYASELAENGNVFCRERFREAGEDLGVIAVAVIKKLGLENSPGRVGACGGTFSAGKIVLTPMQETVSREAPQFQVGPPLFVPVIGALLRALKDSKEGDNAIANIACSIERIPFAK